MLHGLDDRPIASGPAGAHPAPSSPAGGCPRAGSSGVAAAEDWWVRAASGGDACVKLEAPMLSPPSRDRGASLERRSTGSSRASGLTPADEECVAAWMQSAPQASSPPWTPPMPQGWLLMPLAPTPSGSPGQMTAITPQMDASLVAAEGRPTPGPVPRWEDGLDPRPPVPGARRPRGAWPAPAQPARSPEPSVDLRLRPAILRQFSEQLDEIRRLNADTLAVHRENAVLRHENEGLRRSRMVLEGEVERQRARAEALARRLDAHDAAGAERARQRARRGPHAAARPVARGPSDLGGGRRWADDLARCGSKRDAHGLMRHGLPPVAPGSRPLAAPHARHEGSAARPMPPWPGHDGRPRPAADWRQVPGQSECAHPSGARRTAALAAAESLQLASATLGAPHWGDLPSLRAARDSV